MIHRMGRKRAEVNMINGSLFLSMAKFSVPLIITNLLQLFYNSADLIIVGQFSSGNAVGAIGATGALNSLILNLFIGLSAGVSVMVAQGYGAADREKVQKTVHTAIATAFLCGTVMALIGIFFSKTFLMWMQTPQVILEDSARYLAICLLGSPFNLLFNFGASVLRAAGDTKRPLYFLTAAGFLNVLLNFIFVYFFHLDVVGVAIATVLSQVLSAALILLCLTKQTGFCKLQFSKIRIDGKSLVDIMKIGIPVSIQGCVFCISNILIQSSVNSFDLHYSSPDSVPYASGSAAACNIELFVNMAMNAIYQAALTFTGQNFAAKQYKRVRKVLGIAILYVTAVGMILGGLSVIFGTELLSFYIPDDAEAVAIGLRRMVIINATYFLCGIMDVTVGALHGFGKSFVPMLVSVIGICGFRILWIYTVFASHYTWENLFLSYPLSWILTGTLHLIAYFTIQRKLPKSDIPMGDINSM